MAGLEKSHKLYEAGHDLSDSRISSNYYRNITSSFRQRFKITSDYEITGASQLNVRQSILPVCLLSVLYFLWGFTGGLGEALNKHFKDALQLNYAQIYGMHGFGAVGYVIASLTYATYFLRRFGYRWTMMIGLGIYALGAFCIIPSAAHKSYAGLSASGFVIGSGIANLEMAAVLLTSLCGPPRYAEIRILLALGFQVVAQVIASLVASEVIYKPGASGLSTSNGHMESVQYSYAGIGSACVVILLITFVCFPYIPEVTDEDMASQINNASQVQQASDEASDLDSRRAVASIEILTMPGDCAINTIRYQVSPTTTQHSTSTLPLRRQRVLHLGTITLFFFIGAQVALSGSFIPYVLHVAPSLNARDAAHLLAVANSVFAFGRFAFAFLNRVFKPRHTLLLSVVALLALLCCSLIRSVTGAAALALMIAQFFFKATVTPTVFTLSTKGLGANTKRGAGIVVASMCGGAVFAPLLGWVADHRDVKTALVVPLGGVVIGVAFAVWINGWKAGWVDSFTTGETDRVADCVEKGREDSAATMSTGNTTSGGTLMGNSLHKQSSNYSLA